MADPYIDPFETKAYGKFAREQMAAVLTYGAVLQSVRHRRGLEFAWVFSRQSGKDETKARYRETDHVKAFYRTNGYETLKK